MQIKQVLQDKDNVLFNRKEIKIIVESSQNPTKAETTKLLAKKFSKPEQAMAIQFIKGKFGRNTFLITARLYDSEQDMKSTEVRTKKKKEKTN